MKKYDRLIRFYDSWFGDLLEPEKEFEPSECWQVVLAIRECQRVSNCEPLYSLPKELRRALQMATLRTQIQKIIEKTRRMQERGSKGGNATQQGRAPQELELQLEQELTTKSAAELREDRDKQLEREYARKKENAMSYEEYQRRKAAGETFTNPEEGGKS